MKTTLKSMLSAIVLIGFCATSNAQSTATAQTDAILITPISITKDVDMHFGTVGASGTSGTVLLDYADGRTTTGGASLYAIGTLEKTAVFTVTGEGTNSFSISIPSSDITLTSGPNTMTVGTFECDLGTSSSLVGGTKELKVKAILAVGVGQAAGTYTNASDLFVTVNYN